MKCVKLVAKTNKGKNKINEAGKPDHWIVLETRDFVGFSDRGGPWLHIIPDNNVDQSRWVHQLDDRDFNVVFI